MGKRRANVERIGCSEPTLNCSLLSILHRYMLIETCVDGRL